MGKVPLYTMNPTPYAPHLDVESEGGLPVLLDALALLQWKHETPTP